MLAQARALGLGRCTLIGGTGDLALDLAAAGLEVRAVPTHADEAALMDLKFTAARLLPVQSVLSFLGLAHFGRRVWFYHHLRGALRPASQDWADAREAAIRLGLLDAGRFEQVITRLRRALGVHAPEGPRWGLMLRALGTAPLRRASGLGQGRGPGGPADWVRDVPTDSPWCERLATGAWRDPAAAHPWLSAEGLATARLGLPVLADAPDDPGLLVLPDLAEHADEARWAALTRGAPAGTVVLAWERWRRREIAAAEPLPRAAAPDRSPLNATVRCWRIRR